MGGWSIENTLVKIRIGTTAGGVATFLPFPMAKQHPRGGGGSSIFGRKNHEKQPYGAPTNVCGTDLWCWVGTNKCDKHVGTTNIPRNPP